MIDVDAINDYVVWNRNLQMYPPTGSPEEYAEWAEAQQNKAKIIAIKAVLEQENLVNSGIRAKIQDIIKSDLEVKIYD
jgi:hypothetical protein